MSDTLILPFVPSLSPQGIKTVIEDATYVFVARWNDANKSWYLDIYDERENPIALGQRVVLGAFLARAVHAQLTRTGVIIAIDTSGKHKECGFDELGGRVLIARVPQDTYARIIREAA